MFASFVELIDHTIETLTRQGGYGVHSGHIPWRETPELTPAYVTTDGCNEKRCAVGAVLSEQDIDRVRKDQLNNVDVYALQDHLQDDMVDGIYLEAVVRHYPEVFDDVSQNHAARWHFGVDPEAASETETNYRSLGSAYETRVSKNPHGETRRRMVYLRKSDEPRVLTLSVLRVLQVIHDESAFSGVPFTSESDEPTYLSVMSQLLRYAADNPTEFLRHCVGDWARVEPSWTRLNRICRDIRCTNPPAWRRI